MQNGDAMQTNNIVIVGGGSAGWMTAATLRKGLPHKSIKLIESKNIPLVGVGESTLGHINRWRKFIGIEDKDFMPRTNASYKHKQIPFKFITLISKFLKKLESLIGCKLSLGPFMKRSIK